MLTIIIPVFNELRTIDKIVQKILNLENLKKQIIIVDDGSNDGSTKKLKELRKNKKINKIIFNKTNKGKGFAISKAQKFIKGKYVIIQDADLEYNPKDYFKILNILKKKKFKVVYGSRVLNTNRYRNHNFTSIIRVFANHFLTLFSNFINNQKLTDAHTCYKAFDAKIFKKLKLNEKKFAFCPEVTTKISNLNYKIFEVKISYKGRTFKEGKKISLVDGFEALISIVKYKYFFK
jgi:dolichol-phosphate mannosyltransferase